MFLPDCYAYYLIIFRFYLKNRYKMYMQAHKLIMINKENIWDIIISCHGILKLWFIKNILYICTDDELL